MAATLLASGVSIVSLALRSEPSPDAEAADGSSYAVMGVAWLLPCILEPARSRLYLTWAALYAAPFLRDGFDLTGWEAADLDPDELLEMQQFDRQLLERERRRRSGS
ncbi:hypothetical protein HaLaN_30960 [Haematococcus lacustris]|uniref:Uncharacterized protein n=1 Tax=Haematococcus lacustris TaxID=44745 RepID=A0A6A0AGV1_HAELA|nr:hypothetical protein HaLaN_30960 [Haematococcus lacustris]